MADKSVGELIAAQSVTPTDLFVLEQNGTAKKLTGQVLENWLVSFADGHGGIQSIAKLGTSGLADTYRITLADTTTFDFVVTNGRGVSTIKKKSTSGLVDTYAITYNDGTSGTFTVTNGAKGDKGDTAYIWIKYASQMPTESSHSFGDVPDAYMGVYFGTSSVAPTDWQQYKWYNTKGTKGDAGTPAKLVSSTVTYQASNSGTVTPSGSWSTTPPMVAQGKYLWTKITQQFNTGNPITFYTVSRMGIDGTGSVSSVCGISPNDDGNVPLTADNVGALSISGGTMTGPVDMSGKKLTGLNEPVDSDEAAPKGYVDHVSDETIQKVIEALKTPVFGTVDTENNIILTGNLSEGIYVVQYEDSEGNRTVIGTIASGNVVVLIWNKSIKLDATTGAQQADPTNYYAYSDDLYFDDETELVISCTDSNKFNAYWYYYDADGGFVGKIDWVIATDSDEPMPVPETVITQMEGAASVRLRCNVNATNDWGKLDRLTVVRRNKT